MLVKASSSDYDTAWQTDALPAHAAATTGVHGITDTAVLYRGLRLQTGRWYGPFITSRNIGPGSTNRIRGGLLVVEQSITAVAIRAEVASAGTAGSLVRLGIYRCYHNVSTADLVVDAGTIDGTVVGIQQVAISSVLLVPGVYALIAVPQGSPATEPSMVMLQSVGAYPWAGASDSFIVNAPNVIGTTSSGALPGTSAINDSGSPQAPLVQIKVG
ncbi:MAG: hypothetical protein M5U09_12395 [Gammaproteobacteria bacterium]|nr:hypothetical protein [Gammaproteobacteria bacterium]